jgi:hypothetical protein
MAISENILLKMLKGHIGKQMVVRQRGEKTLLCAYPDMSNRKLSPKQLEVNKHMTFANHRARGIISNPEKAREAQARLNVTSNKLYTALVSEYFKELREKAE